MSTHCVTGNFWGLRLEPLSEAVSKSKELDGFTKELVPIDALLAEVKDCFGVR